MAKASLERVVEAAVRLDKLRTETNNAQLAADIAMADWRRAQAEEARAQAELEDAVAQAGKPSPFEGIVEGAQAIMDKPKLVPLPAAEPEAPGEVASGPLEACAFCYSCMCNCPDIEGAGPRRNGVSIRAKATGPPKAG